jgi:serine/threonine protein phosphatase PrpC
MKFSIYQSSRQGGRKYNQDRVAYSYSKDTLLLVVADGMGGHLHGEVAAQLTVQLMASRFQKLAHPVLRDPATFLRQSMQDVHDAIGSYTEEHGLLETPRTTCVACVVQAGVAQWAHVGDSRLYLFRDANLLTRTMDHSKVQQLFEQGRITEEQMSTHPERNKIYNCLGGMVSPTIELSEKVLLQDGDVMLLCSDGLWSMLSINEVASVVNAYPLSQAIQELMDHAEFRGGQDGDNLSAAAMKWGETENAAGAQPVSTATMPMDAFATQIEQFDVAREIESGGVTEEDIERAINEIQTAIKKYSK